MKTRILILGLLFLGFSVFGAASPLYLPRNGPADGVTNANQTLPPNTNAIVSAAQAAVIAKANTSATGTNLQYSTGQWFFTNDMFYYPDTPLGEVLLDPTLGKFGSTDGSYVINIFTRRFLGTASQDVGGWGDAGFEGDLSSMTNAHGVAIAPTNDAADDLVLTLSGKNTKWAAATGSVPDGIVTNNNAGAVTLTNAGNQITATFTGDGSGLTGIPASAITNSVLVVTLTDTNHVVISKSSTQTAVNKTYGFREMLGAYAVYTNDPHFVIIFSEADENSLYGVVSTSTNDIAGYEGVLYALNAPPAPGSKYNLNMGFLGYESPIPMISFGAVTNSTLVGITNSDIWYVDPVFGDDGSSSRGPNLPLKTLDHLSELVGAGDRVVLSPGTHLVTSGGFLVPDGVSIFANGFASAVIPAESAVYMTNNVSLYGLRVMFDIIVRGTNCVVKNSHIGRPDHIDCFFLVEAWDTLLVENCKMEGNWDLVVQMAGTGRASFLNCEWFAYNGMPTPFCFTSGQFTFAGNNIYDMASDPITIFRHGSASNIIVNLSGVNIVTVDATGTTLPFFQAMLSATNVELNGTINFDGVPQLLPLHGAGPTLTATNLSAIWNSNGIATYLRTKVGSTTTDRDLNVVRTNEFDATAYGLLMAGGTIDDYSITSNKMAVSVWDGVTNIVNALTVPEANFLGATNPTFTGVITGPSWQVATNALAVAGVIDMNVSEADYTTNAAFAYTGLANVSLTKYQSAVRYVNNSTASMVAITPYAAWHTSGTWNVTNATVISVFNNAGRWTNAIAYPLW